MLRAQFGTSGVGLRPQPLRVSGCHDLTEHSLRLLKMILNPQEKDEKKNKVKSGSERSVDGSNLFYDPCQEGLRIVQSF